MNRVRKIIEACASKKASDIKETMRNTLDEIAMEKLQEKKEEVASNYMRKE